VLPALTGVEVFIRRLLAGPNDARSLKGVGLCVIGQSSVERFAGVGIKPDVAIGEFRPELVMEALAAKGSLNGTRILMPHAEGARELLTAQLRKSGADVFEVGAYRTERVLPGDPGEPDLYKMLLEQQIDVVTFASPSTVKEFVDIHGADAVTDILRTTAVACVGPVTAQTAQALGITPAIVPDEYSMAAMVAAVVKHFRQSQKT
jgi:uroporphyrinogen III methyltransferase/synthase